MTIGPGTSGAWSLDLSTVFPPGTPNHNLGLQTHEGYEWIYLLSGRLRLLLGEHDLMLVPGEAAEFDTRVPHLFNNPGPEPAEAITLFGPQGERLHVRARPSSR